MNTSVILYEVTVPVKLSNKLFITNLFKFFEILTSFINIEISILSINSKASKGLPVYLMVIRMCTDNCNFTEFICETARKIVISFMQVYN